MQSPPLITAMSRLFALVGILAGLLLLVGGGSVMAEGDEQPDNVVAFPNAPGAITVTWTHSGDGVYWFVIEQESPIEQESAFAFTTADADKRAWTIVGLAPNTTYSYRVCAVFDTNRVCSDENGVGYASVTTLPPELPPGQQRLPAPRNFSHTVGETSVRLCWEGHEDYDYYLVDYEEPGVPNMVPPINTAPGGLFDCVDVPNLLPGRTYVFIVQGCINVFFFFEGNCGGDWSVPYEVSTLGQAPATSRSDSNDFNNDGRGDILWHNASTNVLQVWQMDGARLTARPMVLWEDGTTASVGLPWSAVGSNDFNGDGKTDILWHNASSNETQIWLMDGSRLIGRQTVVDERGSPISVGRPWSIVGSRDFDGDGKTDILWHNASSNETQIWLMDDHRIAGRQTVQDERGSPIFVGAPWSIAGTNDFDGDGKTDILWHNASTNVMQVWQMDGFRIAGRVAVLWEDGTPASVGLPWSIVGTNDFNRDGAADILWHNGSTNVIQIWEMNGNRLMARPMVLWEDGTTASVGLPWRIVNH